MKALWPSSDMGHGMAAEGSEQCEDESRNNSMDVAWVLVLHSERC